MTALKWHEVGSRIYEAGVDRGVLYTSGNPGVPWNGLASVKENPSGGGAQPHYIDGIKHLNLSASEEFEGSLDAFTYPYEFEECDGIKSMGGLMVSQQIRKPFGLSYRTKLGNEVKDQDYGYKIHIIYNALASPTQKSYDTMGDSIEPLTFSWALTTTPVNGDDQGFLSPLSHLVIDSTRCSEVQLRMIEDYLYGTALREPRLPSIEYIFDLFQNPPDGLLIGDEGDNGLYPLLLSAFPSIDLMGSRSKGIYVAPTESRLVESTIPGIYTLEN